MVFNLGGAQAWWWTADENGIPDHPPQLLGTVDETDLVLDDEADDEGGTNGTN